jgi:hypothetical protein
MSKKTPTTTPVEAPLTIENANGFGKKSGTDYSMLINMVYILIGFMISTTEGFLTGRMIQLKEQIATIDFSDISSLYSSIGRLISHKSPFAETWMFLNGSVFLICFLFYLAEYYEKVWVEIFVQSKDKIFFRFYCILIGIYVILLKLFPVFWCQFFSILAILMIRKKWATRNEIRRKIDEENSLESRKGRINAIYILSDAMAYNFTVLSSIKLTIISLMAYISLKFQILWVFLLLSLSCLLICWFWLKKVQSGIDDMMLMLNKGDTSHSAFLRVLQ